MSLALMTLPSDLEQQPALLHSLTEIVASYLKLNALSPDQVPPFIEAVAAVLRRASSTSGSGLDAGAPERPEPSRPTPAVPIEESVSNDYIICLEDGKRLRMLKRYLGTHYNMTPEEYRARWGLPASYPMVAPSYAASKAAFAKRIGLGHHRSRAAAAAAAASKAVASAKRGRGKRAAG
jgi:predicted transcriptional regulator